MVDTVLQSYLATVFPACPMTDSQLVVVIGISISYKITCLAQLCTNILEWGPLQNAGKA